MTDYLDVTSFESTHKNLKLIKTIGDGPWKVELYSDGSTGNFYAKGPFARWDSITYVFLEKVKSKEDVDNWIKQMEDNM